MGVLTIENVVERKERDTVVGALREMGHPSNLAYIDHSTGYYDKSILLDSDIFAYGICEEIYERVLSIAKKEFDLHLAVEQTALIRVVPGNTTEEHADNQNLDGTPKLGCSNFLVSAVVYLNNEFSGGDLVFPGIEYRYRPSAGSCILFPSDLQHRHYVDKVLDGERFSMAMWFSEDRMEL
jgi:hypothetical protein